MGGFALKCGYCRNGRYYDDNALAKERFYKKMETSFHVSHYQGEN